MINNNKYQKPAHRIIKLCSQNVVNKRKEMTMHSYFYTQKNSMNSTAKLFQRLVTNLPNQPTEIKQQKKIDIQKKRIYAYHSSKESHHRNHVLQGTKN